MLKFLYSLFLLPQDLYKLIFLKHKLLFSLFFFSYKAFPRWISKIVINNYFLEIYCFRKYNLYLLYFLKKHNLLQFKTLTDLTVIDVPKNPLRFEVLYNLLSVRYNIRLHVILTTSELMPVFSATSLFSAASWLERECWDLFGVFFFNHNDLRRILTDYGFCGHPLRKDFPLTGYTEVYYDDIKKSIVQIPVSLAQEYRNYYFKSLWKK